MKKVCKFEDLELSNTKYRQRVTSLFKEYNQEVIAILDSYLKNAGYENLLYYDN